MEKFEVFNRTSGQWEKNNIEIVSGWNENWVQDKTTDNMQIKVKYKSQNAPNWKKNDWCRILHLESGNSATYTTATGTRLEQLSTQDIVTYTKTETESEGYYEYTFKLTNYTKNHYELLEPIWFTYDLLIDEELIPSDDWEMLSAPDFEVKLENFNINSLTFRDANVWAIRKDSLISMPLNHEQYIIKDITCVYNEIEEEWDCQLYLQEPIEIMNGVSIETRSFTNQIEKTVDGVVYTHEALNHSNVLETILKTTPANNDLGNSWLNRICIKDRDFLKQIPYNDETLSEQNMYGLLLDKFDNTVGRTPVLYFDMNIFNDLPMNLQKDTYILTFLRQDGFDKESVQMADLVEGNSEYIINKSGDNFADGVISNFDNLAPQKSSKFMSETLWAIPEINNNERSITSYNQNSEVGVWVLKIPQKIKKVNLITRYHFTQSGFSDEWQKTVDNVQVLEKKQYTADTNYDTRNVDWYVEGENIIHLNDFYYRSLGTYPELWLYRVDFEPIISGRYDLAKDYQIQINQDDAQIDSDKFGKRIQDYIASMNKPDIIIKKTVSNFNDIVEIGTRVIDNGKNYLITNISIQNRGFDYDIVYQLNENHFRRNDSIVASQEIRKNIEIGIDATKERKSMLPYEFNLSLQGTANNDTLNVNQQVFSSLLTANQTAYPETALLYIKDKDKIEISKRLCPLTRYIINNTYCFNMRYFDNAEAGKQKSMDAISSRVVVRGLNVQSGDFYTTFYGSPKSQIPVLYTDVFGEIPIFDIRLIKSNASNIENADFSTFTTVEQFGNYMLSVIKNVSYSKDYPIADTDFLLDFAQEIANPVIKIENINYYKDMLDTFNYTVGLNVKSDENIILCKAFFTNSILMTKSGAKIAKVKTYSQNMQENDFAITNAVAESNVTGTFSNSEITISLSSTLNKAKSVILVDTNNQPLLIINDFDKTIEENSFNSIKLYC